MPTDDKLTASEIAYREERLATADAIRSTALQRCAEVPALRDVEVTVVTEPGVSGAACTFVLNGKRLGGGLVMREPGDEQARSVERLVGYAAVVAERAKRAAS